MVIRKEEGGGDNYGSLYAYSRLLQRISSAWMAERSSGQKSISILKDGVVKTESGIINMP